MMDPGSRHSRDPESASVTHTCIRLFPVPVPQPSKEFHKRSYIAFSVFLFTPYFNFGK